MNTMEQEFYQHLFGRWRCPSCDKTRGRMKAKVFWVADIRMQRLLPVSPVRLLRLVGA